MTRLATTLKDQPTAVYQYKPTLTTIIINENVIFKNSNMITTTNATTAAVVTNGNANHAAALGTAMRVTVGKTTIVDGTAQIHAVNRHQSDGSGISLRLIDHPLFAHI